MPPDPRHQRDPGTHEGYQEGTRPRRPPRSPICPMNSTLMPWCSSRFPGPRLGVSLCPGPGVSPGPSVAVPVALPGHRGAADPRQLPALTALPLARPCPAGFGQSVLILEPYFGVGGHGVGCGFHGDRASGALDSGGDHGRWARHLHPPNVWTLFAESSLSHQALVAVLHHFVHVGQHKRANAQQRVFALHSAGLYLLLLEIPVMFDKCLHTLTKCWPQEVKKRKKGQSQSSQPNARRNRKKGKPSRNNTSSMEEMLEEEKEEDDENVYLSTENLLQVRNAIFLLLKNFLRLLPKFSLKEKPQCMQNCVQVFVEMTSFEPVLHEFQFSAAMDVNKAKYIPELAYYGLHLLCVFQRLLSVVLMVESTGGSRREALPITSAVTSARNQAVKFISSLVEELKEAVYPVLRILLQHICTKVPDKGDYRTYAAQALVTLLDKLPCAEFAEFIAWLYKYSLTKVSYRVFALDVALALLELPERSPGSSLSQDQQSLLKHKFLVQVMVFGRCSDKAPVVRSKALSSLAHCLEMKAAATFESIQDLLQSSVSNHPLRTLPTCRTVELTDSSDTAGPDGKDLLLCSIRLKAESRVSHKMS
ncbi:hypothetical protein EK904_013078 [Melospiza melodia maxima]|nr:hypothetical protein EK904_013078 [Melospiza melodia maxima]